MRRLLTYTCWLWAGILLAATPGCGGTDSPAPGGKAKVGGTPAAASGAPAGAKRIIILTNGNSPFWDAGRAGMMEAEKKLDLHKAGLKAVFEVNDGSDRGQIDKLRQFGTQDDIAAVGISVNTAGNVAIVEEMRKLKEKGVHVVAIDSDVDRAKHRDARFAFIGTDNLQGGRELGKCAKGLLPEGGEYVTFVGITGAQNAVERVGGFGQGAGDKFKSKDNMGDDTDRTRAKENVRNALINHPNLKTLVGIWSYNAPAIVDVVGERKIRDKVKVVVFDAEPDAITATGAGMIDAMVVQNPYEMGYQGLRMMKALVEKDEKTLKEMLPQHGQKDGDIYDTGLKVVVPDEGSPLKPEMFDKKTQFLRLKEFRAWLQKYNLKMS